MSFRVEEKGQDPVEVPQAIVAQGPAAIESYVDRARGAEKPLSKMSRPELEDLATELGISEPESLPNVGALREAIVAAQGEE